LSHCENCHALLPVDWKITEDTVVQPDNLVVCFPLEGIYISQAPAVIFEVLSPSTAKKDREMKFNLYEREGVEYYIIVDPTDRIAKVFQRISGKFQKLLDTREETVTFSINDCDMPFNFQHIF
jgi:Uma2 family endonuclease